MLLAAAGFLALARFYDRCKAGLASGQLMTDSSGQQGCGGLLPKQIAAHFMGWLLGIRDYRAAEFCPLIGGIRGVIASLLRPISRIGFRAGPMTVGYQ